MLALSSIHSEAFSRYLPCQVQGTLLGASFSGFFFFFFWLVFLFLMLFLNLYQNRNAFSHQLLSDSVLTGLDQTVSPHVLRRPLPYRELPGIHLPGQLHTLCVRGPVAQNTERPHCSLCGEDRTTRWQMCLMSYTINRGSWEILPGWKDHCEQMCPGKQPVDLAE